MYESVRISFICANLCANVLLCVMIGVISVYPRASAVAIYK
jgi:hypothetical protein